jgi:dTDP-4-dehydrorhamnose 3,5-epimerase-like enzyme
VRTTIDDCRLLTFPEFKDKRGILNFCELNNVKRVFWINEPTGRRGYHAHKTCHQIIVCVRGKCTVNIDDGTNKKDIILDTPSIGLLIPEMIWDYEFDFSDGATVLVFASHHYDKSDYITDYNEFIGAKKVERPIVFYVLNGQQYLDEAAQSVTSLKKQMSTAEAHLFYFGKGEPSNVFDAIHLLPYDDTMPWYSNSIRGFNEVLSAFQDNEKLVYLDGDTYVCSPFYEVYRFLDRFDLTAIHSSGRITTGSVLDVEFPEYHIGLIGIKNNAKIKALFAHWLELYNSNLKLYGDNDQGPLRDAIWQSDVNTYIMPPEYCFRFPFGGFLAREVKTLHGRSKNMAKLAQLVNASHKMRTFERGFAKGI